VSVWHTLCNNSKPVSLVVNNRVMVLGTGRDDRSLFFIYF
jgi:hypothetical protein